MIRRAPSPLITTPHPPRAQPIRRLQYSIAMRAQRQVDRARLQQREVCGDRSAERIAVFAGGAKIRHALEQTRRTPVLHLFHRAEHRVQLQL